jgi:hypothetical protein
MNTVRGGEMNTVGAGDEYRGEGGKMKIPWWGEGVVSVERGEGGAYLGERGEGIAYSGG